MSEFWFRFFYALVWPIFNLIHPIKAVGREGVPREGCLLCGNHTRYSDPLFIVFALGRKDHPYIMGKAELFRRPILGWVLTKCGVISVDRGKSDIKAIKESMRVLKNGSKLLLFPEGTRVKEGEDQEAKTGAAMLAARTGAPIVPVWVPARLGWFRKTTVVFGEPYYPDLPTDHKVNTEDYHRIASDLMDRIRALAPSI